MVYLSENIANGMHGDGPFISICFISFDASLKFVLIYMPALSREYEKFYLYILCFHTHILVQF